jgi:riboflavin kinase/FMN adenylyltransferase
MHVWVGLESIPEPFSAASVAIGTFDGVHRGHQALISAAVADARAHGRPSLVFTFDRHPSELLTPERAPGYLCTPAQRQQWIEELGVDHLVIARFDSSLREMTPEAFLRDILTKRLGARAVLVGEGFRFGRNQEGDIAFLEAQQERLGYTLHVLAPVLVGGERASSSRIRTLLRRGDLEAAEAILGRPYALTGVVVEGEKLGRRLGYPTANLRPVAPMVVPADGIYAVRVRWRERRAKGACSIGMRPTVGGTQRTIEVFLLDFSGDLYGETLEIEFAARLRDELRFQTLEALVEQMGRDVAQVSDLLT